MPKNKYTNCYKHLKWNFFNTHNYDFIGQIILQKTLQEYPCRPLKLAEILHTEPLFGREICVTPLHCSYGQIGYTINFPYANAPEVEYDWEMNKLTIDDENWKLVC